MNSSTNSELGLLSNSSPSQSLVKVKSSSNKENKLQRFGGAVVNGGTLVFGKIKSLWSHNSTGLNTMLSDTRRKSQDNLGLYRSCLEFFFSLFELFFSDFVFMILFRDPLKHGAIF